MIAIVTTTSKKDLIHATNNITLRKLKENNINNFVMEEVENILLWFIIEYIKKKIKCRKIKLMAILTVRKEKNNYLI